MYRLLTICIILLSLNVSGQKLQFGVGTGGMVYYGDLNPNASMKLMNPAVTVFGKNVINDRAAFKHAITYSNIEGRDDIGRNAYQRQRNLSFRSEIYELSTNFEFNFLSYGTGNRSKPYTPYLSLGFSVFYFNPKAYYNGEWVPLQPLGTEGQNNPEFSGADPYELIDFSIPFGGGFKLRVSRSWELSFDFIYRKTFTDYLDDVGGVYTDPLSLGGDENNLAYELADRSEEITGERIGEPGYRRATSSNKDDYFTPSFSISYIIMKLRCPRPSSFR